MSTNQKPPYAIGPLLRRAHRRAAEAFNEALLPLNIQGRHFGVLLTLHRLGPVSQRRLTDQLGSDTSSMVRMIDDLEGRGLCVRQPDPHDRRAYAIALTPAGQDLFADAEHAATRVSAELLADLTPTDRDLLCQLLTRFVTAETSTAPRETTGDRS